MDRGGKKDKLGFKELEAIEAEEMMLRKIMSLGGWEAVRTLTWASWRIPTE